MLRTILMMYVTLLPTIVAGIFNMAWVMLPVAKFLKKPIDGGHTMRDGRRIFGDNKTWKGIAGYVLLNTVFTVLWGFVCLNPKVAELDFFYLNHGSTIPYNILVGVLLGLGYSLFELPNSFLKRRLDIEPGKTIKGFRKVFFIFLDQADSIFGVALVVWIFYDIGILLYLGFVAVGAATHIILNMLLYAAHLRKNMF